MTERKKKDTKFCGVCGAPALGSNFNAITCESCKAFFRRNAIKTKDFKCPYESNCNVDTVTRRFCQKCRLKKCFEIGMKKEWIMTEEEKQAKRQKIEKNKLKKALQQQSTSTPDLAATSEESPDSALHNVLPSPSSSMSPMTPQTPGGHTVIPEPQMARVSHQPLTPSDQEYSPPAKIVILEQGDETVATVSSTSSPSPLRYPHKEVNPQSGDSSHVTTTTTDTTPLQSDTSSTKQWDYKTGYNLHNTSPGCKGLSDSLSIGGLPDRVYEKALAIEFAELPIRASGSNSKELSPLEKAKLNELIEANTILELPLAYYVSDPSLLDVINMTDHAIRRLIKMSKRIVAFDNLCQPDQISLMKGGCTELMILRSVMSYDPEKECWRVPQGLQRMSIKVDILKEAKGNVYEEHKRFINSFEPQWRTDDNIMLILSAIALFTPERPNTLHREAIKMEQDTYYYLLRRYLECTYNSCEAKTTYLRLIQKIQELHNLNENHVRVYLDVNPKDVEPLLIEIFDLK